MVKSKRSYGLALSVGVLTLVVLMFYLHSRFSDFAYTFGDAVDTRFDKMLAKLNTMEQTLAEVKAITVEVHNRCVTVVVGSNEDGRYSKTATVPSFSAVCPTYIQEGDDKFQVLQHGQKVHVYRTDGTEIGWGVDLKAICCDPDEKNPENSAIVRPLATRWYDVDNTAQAMTSWAPSINITSTSSIPQIIWQTSKTNDVPAKAKELANTWLFHNPEYELRFVTDADMETFFAKHLPGPTHDTFKAMPIGVMKADMWRLAVVYIHGGVYADMDTMSMRPIRDWMEPGCRAIIGKENWVHFCNWAFAAEKKHPVFKAALDLIVERVQASGGAIDTNVDHFVHAYTGPGVLSIAISRLLKNMTSNYTEPHDGIADAVADHFAENFAEYGVCFRNQSFFGTENVKNGFASQKWHDPNSNTGSWESWTKAVDNLQKERGLSSV